MDTRISGSASIWESGSRRIRQSLPESLEILDMVADVRDIMGAIWRRLAHLQRWSLSHWHQQGVNDNPDTLKTLVCLDGREMKGFATMAA